MNTVEHSILTKLENILADSRADFAVIDVTFDEPKLQILDSSPDNYSSEICVMIRRNLQIDDALEFQLYSNGKQLISENDALAWFLSELGKVRHNSS